MRLFRLPFCPRRPCGFPFCLRTGGRCLLRPGEACTEDGPCSAHGAWSEVKATYLRFLETTTLADIQDGPAESARRTLRRRRAARAGRTTWRRWR